MFEKNFESLGHITEKHSGKIIIAWVVLILVMAPFASLLFSQTSYDLAGSIVPSDSMAQLASDKQTEYFSGNSTDPGGNQTMVVVTSGTSIDSNQVIQDIISVQNNLTSYFNSNGINSSFQSIVNVENSTLYGVAQAASGFLELAYPLISEMNSQSFALNQSINGSISIVLGLPAYYLANLSQNSGNPQAESIAYNATLNSTQGNPVEVSYFNAFASYFNSTGEPTLAISQAVNDSSLNATLKILENNQYFGGLAQIFYSLKVPISQNFTMMDLKNVNFTTFKKYVNFEYNYTVPLLASGWASNSTLTSLLQGDLNLTSFRLVSDSFNVSQPAKSFQLTDLADSIVTSGIVSYFNGNPLVKINSDALGTFVKAVNSSADLNVAVSQTLVDFNFSSYPAIPQDYILHQFVGYDNSTIINIIIVNQNLTLQQNQYLSDEYHNAFNNLHTNVGDYVAGSSALSNQLAQESLNGMIRALLIGIVLSVIIVGVFFRAPIAAILPLTIFGVSAEVSMSLNGIIYKYILHTTVSFITPTLLLILLLGLTSDYVVYIMARYRRELRGGNKHPSVLSAKWSGHAVFTSGLTVAISYVALYISGVPIFSDSGITNAIGVLVAILAANTLLLAMLNRGSRRIFWPANLSHQRTLPAEKSMTKIGDFVVKNKGKIVIIFVVASLLASYVYLETPTNFDVFDLVPSSSGIQALKVVNSSFNGDYFDRGFVILQFSSPVYTNGTFNATEMNEVTYVEKSLLASNEISQVYGPTYPYGSYVQYNLSTVPSVYHSQYLTQMESYIGNNTNYVIVDFQLSSLAWTDGSTQFMKTVPGLVTENSPSYEVYVGGETQGLNDAYSFTLNSFSKMVPILAIAIFIVLFIQLSSLFTPLRLILMVLASVIISLSLTYIVLHTFASLPILIFLPMFTVITLLAVGLDYDIFMVTRVREEAFKGNSDEYGVRTSLTENGGVIMTLGTLLFATFGSLAFSGIGIIQEMGVGLALGVLIDTFISWPFFVPAIMLYLKKYNWWPSKLRRSEVDEFPGEK